MNTSPDQSRPPAPAAEHHHRDKARCICGQPWIDTDTDLDQAAPMSNLPPDQMTALERRLTQELAEARRVKDDDNAAKVAYFAEAQELRAQLAQANAVVQAAREALQQIALSELQDRHSIEARRALAALDAPPSPQDEA